MEKGIIPEQWKIAKVLPLHKKGSKKKIENYRPISNLCSVTKIFENLVLQRIREIEILEGCDLTGNFQHGFKKERSTETACLEVQSKIAQACDTGDFVVMAGIDMSAAFDVVDHDILMKRLKTVGLPKILLKVLWSWLTQRSFYCEIGGKTSVFQNITHGTVQGSVLGPVLFAIFIAPLEDNIPDVVAYADDINQISSHREEQTAINICVNETSEIITWLRKNGMQVNNSKTEMCVFHKGDTRETEVMLDGIQITTKKSMKVLGVIFDTKLTWYEHISKTIVSANKVKQGLAIISKYFSDEEMLKLATANFYSRLYYASKVWLISTIAAPLKKKLWQVSSRMLKIVKKDWRGVYSYKELHKICKRATPQMWNDYVTAIAMRDIICNQIPLCVVPKIAENVLHNTRRQGLSFTRSNQLKIGFNCISNRLQLVSSKLKMDWTTQSKDCYKNMCKKMFINEALLTL